MSSFPDSIYAHAFYLNEEVDARHLHKLKNYFGTFESAFHASFIEWQKAGLADKLILQVKKSLNDFSPAKEMSLLAADNISLLTTEDEIYPPLLKEIYLPPPLIYFRGQIPKTKIYLAIVGPRRATAYGREVVRYLLANLPAGKVTIVSGLARGIDAEAHFQALKNNLPTIAVLGSGVSDSAIYPRQNLGLAKKILTQKGALISEYPPTRATKPFHFPARNRLIAGLCQHTIIIEAPLKSGALITAACGLEQNRNVLAVPGSIFSASSFGAHQLIINGAQLVASATDLLENLGLENEQPTSDYSNLNNDEIKIITALQLEPKNFDFLCKQTGLSPNQLLACLTNLEMTGKVRNLGNQTYSL